MIGPRPESQLRLQVQTATSAERLVAAETLAAALTPYTSRTIQDRLERLLLDDRELLISLQCQLEQIRREFRLLNDERIVASLVGQEDVPIRH